METSDRISELYNGLAGDSFSQAARDEAKQRIHWMCSKVTGPKVIDIGCSQGIASILLAREGSEVVGVDIDKQTIEYANSDKAKEPPEVQKRLTFVNSSIYSADLPAKKFNTAIMGEFLEHQVKPEKAILRAYELLADGGRLIVTVPFGMGVSHADHKHVFYVAPLYKLLHSYFQVSQIEIVGRYLCLVAAKRKAVIKTEVKNIDLALVEKAEQAFQEREEALVKENLTSNREKGQLKTKQDALTAQLGDIKKDRDTLTTQLGGIKKERDTLTTQLGGIKKEKDALTVQLGGIRKEKDALTAQLGDVRKERDRLKTDREALTVQLGDIKKEKDRLKVDTAALTVQLGDVRKEKDLLKIDRDALTVELGDSNKEKEQVKAELLGTRQKLDREKRELNALESSFSYQFGHMLVQAVRKPGSNTLLLPWHLVQLMRLRKVRRTSQPGKHADETASAQQETATAIKSKAERLLRSSKLGEWVELEEKHRDMEYFTRRAPFVYGKFRLLQHGFQPGAVTIPKNYHQEKDVVFYLLHNSLPFATGGYAIRTHGLMKALMADGWHMYGITRPGFPFDVRAKQGLNVPKIAANEIVPDMDVIDSIPYLRIFDAKDRRFNLPTDMYLQTYVEKVLGLCDRHKPALLHGVSDYRNGIAASAAARLLGIPSVYTVRGLWEITHISRDPEWEHADEYRLQVRMETDACLQSTAVIAITQKLKDLLIERGVPGEKILVVPNGVDTTRFVPIPRDSDLEARLGCTGKKVIGYVGAFAPYEGLEYLMQAADILRRKGRNDFRVLLVGDGVKHNELEAMCSELQLREIVTITGRVPHDEIEKYYSLIDIVPLPRKGVPVCEIVSPLKPFEAMAMGKPVVASNVAALAEIVLDGETGLLHRKDDADHLAHTLETLLDNPELACRLGNTARQWVVANRDWSTLAQSVSNLYRELIKK